MTASYIGRSLTVVVCGAGPAGDVGRFVDIAVEDGWTVQVVATPAALQFLDPPALEVATGTTVRSSYRTPEHPGRVVPNVDAVVIAPATYNTINKLAAGIADNYALGNVAEAVGRGVPVVVVPFVNAALAARVPFRQALHILRTEGVRVILGPDDGWVPHSPGTGGERQRAFPWAAALRAVEHFVRHGQP